MRGHARVVRDYGDSGEGEGESIDIYFGETFRVNFRGLLPEVGLNDQCLNVKGTPDSFASVSKTHRSALNNTHFGQFRRNWGHCVTLQLC